MATLNHRVTIRRQAAGEDSHGQPNGAWVDHDTVWADVAWPTGIAAYRERVLAGVDVSTMGCSVMLRRRSDINAGMRVLHDGVEMDIQGVSPSNLARDMMYLMCQRVDGVTP